MTYWCALVMTVALASCAFVLSFDALRSLAITLGLPPSIAWLWPCAIDVAIAQATLCLLSLSRRRPAVQPAHTAAARTSAPRSSNRGAARRGAARRRRGRRLWPVPVRGAARDTPPDRRGVSAAPVALVTGSHNGEPAVVESVDGRGHPALAAARNRLSAKVLRPGRELVATILAEREAGTPPSTIGRNYRGRRRWAGSGGGPIAHRVGACMTWLEFVCLTSHQKTQRFSRSWGARASTPSVP